MTADSEMPERRTQQSVVVTGHGMLPPETMVCEEYVLWLESRLARTEAALKVATSALNEARLLATAIINDRTHYEGCAADHPWCEVYGKVQNALAQIAALEGKP